MEKPAKKPALSFWEIWNMSFGFLGIQFGFALQNANVSRIFETLGASIDNIPILWIAAPVTGLIVQPIIGHYSDKTWTRLGRRRPYFLVGAILASLGLIVMPNSPVLWVAAGTLWMLDASINISMEPFRAFVGDMLPSYQRTKGFAMQSFFIGTGAVVASALPYMLTNWFSISNTAPAGEIPLSVKWSFYLGAGAFLFSVLWTVFRSREYPPEVFERYSGGASTGESLPDGTREHRVAGPESEEGRKFSLGLIFAIAGFILSYIVYTGGYDWGLSVFSIGLFFLGIIMLAAGLLQKTGQTDHGLVVVMTDFLHMPKTMLQLSFVQFFSWFALFAMWIYTTAAVTSHIYGTSDTTSILYNEGANWVGICFAAYNGFAALVAFALPPLARMTSRKTVHSISLLAGGASLAGIYYIGNPGLLLLPMLGIGIAWASILAMPYAILSGALPPKKMGVYMGIFNFFIVIPQIVAASILGFMLRNFFGGETIYALVTGGASLAVAALLMLFVDDVDEDETAADQSAGLPAGQQAVTEP